MSKPADHDPLAWIAQGRKERPAQAAKAPKPVRKAPSEGTRATPARKGATPSRKRT